jgi:[acyl-carrier-protein] S-malonyltransferase
MVGDGVTLFTEVGTGTVLQGLIRKIAPEVEVESISTI